MKPFLSLTPSMLLAIPLVAAEVPVYTNYLRQFQTPTGVVWDAFDTVDPIGTKPSALAIQPGGARFDLWTVRSTPAPYTEYLLDTKYVSTYTPTATVVITSEDPYAAEDPDATTPPPYPLIPRTRADRPFFVTVTVSGLSTIPEYPAAAKSVTFNRHVQSYGTGGTGLNLDRTQATLLSQASIATLMPQTLTYTLTSIPGADRTKVRGEERFSVFTLLDSSTTPATASSQLASKYIQIWPVADGSIVGITQGQVIRTAMPPITLTWNDVYPCSRTYAQVYKGSPQLGVTGTVVPSSNLQRTEAVPYDRVQPVSNYDAAFDSDGLWTMELLVDSPPWPITRLAYVSFTLDRTIEVNSGVTTIE